MRRPGPAADPGQEAGSGPPPRWGSGGRPVGRPGPRRPSGRGRPGRAGRPEPAERPAPRQASVPAARRGPGKAAGGLLKGASQKRSGHKTAARPAGVALPRSKVLLAAAGALAVVAAVVVVTILVGGDENASGPAGPRSSVGRPAGSGSAPSSYSSSPSSSVYEGIDRREEDSEPLTEQEAFPAAARSLTVAAARSRLRLVGARVDGDCAEAVWGAALGEELRRGGCTQAVRGMYADTRRGYALSVTIFNLATSADADRLVEALGRGRGGFVRPLTDTPGGVVATPTVTLRPSGSATAGVYSLADFGRGFSMARGLAMGHYAVIAWAQRLDGTGEETDGALLALLIEGGKAPAVLGRAAGVK
ncbi:hypothetical protein [uncultured Thermomonospora sp.]|uniref:hypothetical protein n=1 Tax=uncultured Thermomonospora sp. TaxID=671175 RepID=UPI00259B5C44|nr:hypothetical protein [uncultured Thermomonospora sp.]